MEILYGVGMSFFDILGCELKSELDLNCGRRYSGEKDRQVIMQIKLLALSTTAKFGCLHGSID